MDKIAKDAATGPMLPTRLFCDICGSEFDLDNLQPEHLFVQTFADARNVCDEIEILIYCARCRVRHPIQPGGSA